MTPTTADPEGGLVRIPADLDRPDRILVGLTARQLAILAAGGVLAWALVGLLEPLVGLAVAAGLAGPVALAAIALTVGWREGMALDRLAVAGLSWWRHPGGWRSPPTAFPRRRPGLGRRAHRWRR